MPDRHDDLDSWLDGRIEPLPPPPGTFDLIKRRARRRKYRRLAVTAGAAAVIVAAAVTVPQVVNLPVLNPAKATGVGATGTRPRRRPARGASTASSSAVPVPVAAPAPVPANFRPTSVTFIGTDTGWVIGQAGTPGHCATQYCTSVARTDDAGKTWTGVPAPVTGPADGATGVSQIRFLNLSDGWAFGPGLFATHDGGRTWTQVVTERAAGHRPGDGGRPRVRAVRLLHRDRGGVRRPVHQLHAVLLPRLGRRLGPGGPLDVGAHRGGRLARAHRDPGLPARARRHALRRAGGRQRALAGGQAGPCPVGTPLADGQPTGALLAAATAANLVLVCASSSAPGAQQAKRVFTSADGGIVWQNAAAAPALGLPPRWPPPRPGRDVLATSQGIDVAPAGSAAWQAATLEGPPPAAGFGYVGMTTDSQGVALPADPTAGAVWFTFDGGQTWMPSPVS